MLLAGWRAVREYDLKLILAFGTVSQLGLITVLVGAGGGDLMLAGLAMLCAHAMFKAALFMVVGIIDHATGTRDIRRARLAGAATAAAVRHRRRGHREHGRAAAVPRLRRQGSRFRDAACTARHWAAAAPVVLGGVVAGSVFTTIYSLRFLWGAFARKGFARTQHTGGRTAPPVGRLSWSRRRSWRRPVWCSDSRPACSTTRSTATPHAARRLRAYHLALWHGLGLPLLLSALVLAGGTAMFFAAVDCPAPDLGKSATCRWATPTGSTTTSCAIRHAGVQADRRHPARLDTGDPVGHPGHAGSAARWRVLATRAHDRPQFQLWDSPLSRSSVC